MRRIKKKDYEDLSAENVKRVHALLNPEEGKPITKKEACSMLNISYNTTRLDKIIVDYFEQLEYVKKRKKQVRGTAISDGEIAEIAKSYLRGDSLASIAKSLYRSTATVKAEVEKIGIPSRPAKKEDRADIGYIPEQCVSETFEKGQWVYSARHHSLARVVDELSVDYQAERMGFSDINYESKYSSKCYAIYVIEPIDQDKEMWVSGIETGGYSAYALAYDLGSLKHLEDRGLKLENL